MHAQTWVSLIVVTMLAVAADGAVVLQLDSEEHATEAGVVLEGAWQESSHTGGYVGDNYLHDQNSNDFKSVYCEFTVPQSGLWDVQIIWTDGDNRATAVPVTVAYQPATGDAIVSTSTVDQTKSGGTWTSVVKAPLPVTAGKLLTVRIANYSLVAVQPLIYPPPDPTYVKVPINPAFDGYVIADAVRLELVPEPASAAIVGLGLAALRRRRRRHV